MDEQTPHLLKETNKPDLRERTRCRVSRHEKYVVEQLTLNTLIERLSQSVKNRRKQKGARSNKLVKLWSEKVRLVKF